MSRQLRALFISIDATGHINACIGVAQALMASGYSVTFVMNEQWKGYFTKYGFNEILLPDMESRAEDNMIKDIAIRLVDDGVNCPTTPLENSIKLNRKTFPIFIERTKQLDNELEKILPTIQKDVILIDNPFCLSSVVNSGTPWVNICSANILYYLEDNRTPPVNSGLPTVGHENEWKEFRSIIHKFPEELDYTDLRPLPDNWHRFDNFMRRDKHLIFEIPDKLKGKPGKLVYFSLGSTGAANVDNMNRLLGILSKSNNRFIISMGPQYESIKLYDNMWGQSSVPQIQVLPLVDLVITHGGNNTTTETFYFGKPLIVMPLFGDQWDNAQRVEEKGFGLRLDAYKCTEKELLSAIDTLLNDNKLSDKLKQISQRIQQENKLIY
ncbi:uncharacterized UDP-glucosyltransferase YdhE-like [Oppia nitens]|uniref:uncharacterized UDP-glucosyltransferase YdhE-like n=1 Tax=Oppia nitens TaxID=1686743 RepID=UPI0023DB94D8|nr:uncharacterized UDP-glucosyltransferase YdhE-like [Oppia nitens]